MGSGTAPLTLTFLGTGGAFTDFRVNYHNNLLVETHEGPVLIDCGGTAPQALRELGIRARDLRAVIVTHIHGDHVGGLEQLLWERYYLGRDGPDFLTTPILATSEVLSGVRACVEPLVEHLTRPDRTVGTDGWQRLVVPQVLRGGRGSSQDDAEVVTLGGVEFSLHRTPHVSAPDGGKACFGVRARRPGGGEVYFTSDTEFRADIGQRFDDAHVLFHDCTFMEHYEGTVHTHWTELCSLPAPVRARTVLMHHTRVPADVDVIGAGFLGAARRFDCYRVDADGSVSVGLR